MWLFTKHGFFSVVRHKDDPDQMLVRARFRDDLERFLKIAGRKDLAIDDHSGTDYPYRVFLPRADWESAAAALAAGIDYPNFKDAAHGDDPARNAALFDVWDCMRRAQKKL